MDNLNTERAIITDMAEDEELEKVARRIEERSELSKQTYKKGREAADLPD